MNATKHFITDIPQKAILEYRGKVLLIMGDNNFWELPGGRLHVGEIPADGIRREIKEEISIDIEPLDVFDVAAFTSPSGNNHFLVFYLCQPLTDISGLKIGDGEVLDMRWIDESELDSVEQIRPQYKVVLRKFFRLRS